MKSKTSRLLLVLLGAGLMAIFQLLTHCNKDDDFLKDSINAKELKTDLDIKGIEKTINKIEDAFKANDQVAINALTFSETLELQSANSLNLYSSEELAVIAKALRKAKRSVVTSNFAEYTYTIEKIEFSITLALDGDDEWKLLRY